MLQIRAVFAIFILSGAISAVSAQSTGLVIQISAEAHVGPATIPLSFTVTSPGETVTNQPVTVTAWVRALPGQQIQLTSQIASLTGPDGSHAVTALSWNGTMGRVTGGATSASCTSGTVSGGSAQSMISGWSLSGIATCKVSFSLTTDATWPAGTYTGLAVLSLLAQ